MHCSTCGTDTPAPAIACQTCSTPFPSNFARPADSETIGMTAGPVRTPGPARGTGPLEVGQPFGPRYRILRELGAGGMGVVYQAWDSELGVAVALKVVRPEVNADPQTAQEVERRFKRELLLARQVTHKHVVRIHDLGEIDGIKYITMPYIEGRDLAAVLRERGKLPAPEALRLGRQIAQGLVAAHDAGVVHRDLKPENVMIDHDGQALIMDFGISQSVTAGTSTATAAGAIMGTLEYMAPEQARGAALDHRADLYAFGLILYDMLAGRRRISGGQSALSEMMARMQEQPTPLRTVAPEVPDALERVVTKCLQPQPEQRYATTRALVDALESLDPDGSAARRPIARDYQWKVATATMLVLVLLAAGAAVWFAQHRGGPAAPPAPRDPVSILIADFENGPRDPVFDGALEQALGLAMEGAPFVTNYSRLTAKQLATRLNLEGAGGRMNESAARLIASREGIKVVLAGRIVADGSGYRVDVKAIDPGDGKELTTPQTASAGSKSDVLQAMATVANGMRSALGDTTPGKGRAAAETFTTNSLQALSAYDQGQTLSKQGKSIEALAKFQEAVTFDKEFGRAWANIAAIQVNLKQPAEAKANYETAFKYLDRMSDREKFRMQGLYYLGVTREYDRAIEAFEALVKQYPADNAGYSNLALAYVYVRDLKKAAETSRHGLEVYPKNLVQRTNYATYSMYAGDFDNAVIEAEKVLKENPKYEWAGLTLALSRAAQGRDADARAVYATMRGMSALGYSLAVMGEADLEMSFGRLRQALKLLQDGVARDEKDNPGNLPLKLIAVAEAQMALGNKAEAIKAAERAAGLSTHEAVLVPAAHLLTQLERDGRAQEIARQLAALVPAQLRSYALVITGEVKLSRDNVVGAIDDFKAAQKLHDSWYVHLLLGDAYEKVQDWPSAVAERELCVRRRGEATDVFIDDTASLRYLPPVYYHLGRAQEAVSGSVTAGARASYESFLKARDAADPPDLLAADARRRLGR
ncbi:MAG TPA: protein kinase [Vicinamibacterales bacterium]|nr:protein kinase [Vicinamibacterales bacterium]